MEQGQLGKEKLPRYFLIILGIVILILIAEGFYYFFGLKRRPGTGVKKEAQKLSGPITKAEYPKIARMVLDWLDKQRDEKGVYISGRLCQVSGECKEGAKDNRAGLTAIWGRFKFYQVYQEEKDLGVLTRDLEIYTDRAKVPVIKNDFWNCKLMFQMWQSDLLFDSQKEKLQKICWYGIYPSGEPERVGGIPDLQGIIESKPSAPKHPSGLSALSGKMTQYSAFSSDFSARYLWKNLWKKDERDLRKAVSFFKKAVNLYSQETSNAYLSGKWVLGIASLDLYKATQESKYLDFAIALSEKEVIEDICVIGETSPGYCQDSLLERVTANLFLRQLFEATGDERYKNTAVALTQKTIEAAFDAQGLKGFFVGDGSFNSFDRGISTEGINVYKPVMPNGLIIGVLSEDY